MRAHEHALWYIAHGVNIMTCKPSTTGSSSYCVLGITVASRNFSQGSNPVWLLYIVLLRHII